MNGIRTELPWNKIQEEVKKAIDQEMPETTYINVNRLVDQVQSKNPDEYPLLGGLLVKTMKYRCTRVMRHIWKWETYSNGNGRGTVFIRGDVR